MRKPRRAGAMASAFALILLAGCTSTTAPSDDGATSDTPPSDDGGGLSTLAKVGGWRQGLDRASIPGEAGFAVLELAYDEAGAHAVWNAAVPDGLPTTSGAPTGFGIYGAVEDVDLADHVVGLWSSGQSGSCPGWLGSVDSDSDAVTLVQVEDLQGFDLCADDYNAYSQVVVLNRDQVPPPETLPVDGQLTFAMVTDATGLPGNGPTLRAVITPFTE